MKLKNLSSSLDHRALANNLYKEYGNYQNINIQNLNNDNYYLKQNDRYKNYNINQVSQKNRNRMQQDFILPSIKQNVDIQPILEKIEEEKRSLNKFPKNGKIIKGDKEENNNFLNNDNNNYNFIKEKEIIDQKNKKEKKFYKNVFKRF